MGNCRLLCPSACDFGHASRQRWQFEESRLDVELIGGSIAGALPDQASMKDLSSPARPRAGSLIECHGVSAPHRLPVAPEFDSECWQRHLHQCVRLLQKAARSARNEGRTAIAERRTEATRRLLAVSHHNGRS